MTFTAASQQGVIKMSWPHYGELSGCPFFIQSLLYTDNHLHMTPFFDAQNTSDSHDKLQISHLICEFPSFCASLSLHFESILPA